MSHMSPAAGDLPWPSGPEAHGTSPGDTYFVGIIGNQAVNGPSPPLSSPAPPPPAHRGAGELDALRAALGRVEAALDEERARAGAIQRGVRRAAEDRAAAAAAQAQTLSQKIEREKVLRRELRQELAAASEQLRAVAQRNAHLATALAASQRVGEAARAERGAQDAELERARDHAVSLQIRLHEAREELEAGESCQRERL